MNKKLEKFARDDLKTGLAKLTEEQQLVFKRMYSQKNLDAAINDIVGSMPEDKFDWAMEQVDRTIAKNG